MAYTPNISNYITRQKPENLEQLTETARIAEHRMDEINTHIATASCSFH